MDGTGAMMRQMLPKIGDLASSEMHTRLKDDDIAVMIKNGRDKMPPFGSVFKDDQIAQIVAYVRSLGGREPKSATPVRDDHLQAKRKKSP